VSRRYENSTSFEKKKLGAANISEKIGVNSEHIQKRLGELIDHARQDV
jgi:hypothetical protein